MPDWKKIKAEYIRGGVGLRKLAQKHGVSFSAIARASTREKWTDLRKQSEKKTNTLLAESCAVKEAKRIDRIESVADKILTLIEQKVNSAEAVAYPGQELRFLSMSLKDIAQVKGYKTELDLKEQKARIAKLEKEAKEEEQTDNKVVVVIESGDERYDE